MITFSNIHAHELVGLSAKVLKSPDPSIVGVSGVIISETKNTLTLRSRNGIKRIGKSIAKKIEIATPCGACFISGSSLIARPEDRVSRL